MAMTSNDFIKNRKNIQALARGEEKSKRLKSSSDKKKELASEK
jgi:hypothetical protein